MDIVTFLTFLSSLLAPLISATLSNHISFRRHLLAIVGALAFFTLHNIFFLLGYSLKGDNIDYIIFAIEYPFVVLIIVTVLKIRKNIVTKTTRILGYIAMILIILYSCLDIIMPFPVNMDCISDKQIAFRSNDKTYQVRRYNFSFATLMNAKFTYETYRTFEYLPFEKKIDKTVIWDNRTELNVWGDLSFEIKEFSGYETLTFSSGKTRFTKKLK